MKRRAICRCEATTGVFGIAVCEYHFTHGESDPSCPTCQHPMPTHDLTAVEYNCWNCGELARRDHPHACEVTR